MKLIYTFIMRFTVNITPWLTWLHPKLKKREEGQRCTFDYLTRKLSKSKKTLWVHAASLGEYELCVPVLEAFKEHYPHYQIVLTFFSPSGYELRRENPITSLVCYLPWDTPRYANRFLSLVSPDLVFIIKNEFWVHYLEGLYRAGIPTFLISGRFIENQFLFTSRGRFIRKALKCFNHFFVINETSAQLIKDIGFEQVTVSGDTGIDRTLQLIDRDNTLPDIAQFIGDARCIVCGSIHLEDEALLLPIIEKTIVDEKYILVPHEVYPKEIARLKSKLSKKVMLYSEIDNHTIQSNYDVLIVDTVGILTKIYSYADIAYVGGGMQYGDLHNVLEPAAFELPILIGKHYQKFDEAKDLVSKGGIVSVKDTKQIEAYLKAWLTNSEVCNRIGKINLDYLQQHQGATKNVLSYLKKFLKTV